MLYLDNAATMPIVKESAEAANYANSVLFLNPSALYAVEVNKHINDARATIAAALGVSPQELYFTSGATEANNLAILGGIKNKNLSFVTSSGEHASVFAVASYLKGKGMQTQFAALQKDASVDADAFIQLAADNCGLASLIHASNETGVIHDIASIFKEVKKRNPRVLVHSDGVQAFLKTDVSLASMPIDMYSISGHKIGAPKGIGALYVRKGCAISSLIHGGGQEKGLRSGTENVSGILAFAAACKAFKQQYKQVDYAALRDLFCKTLLQHVENCAEVQFYFNAQSTTSYLPHLLSMSILGVPAEILQRILMDKDGIIVGLGSACAASKRGNRVLEAAKKTKIEIAGNIRISFGLDITVQQVQEAAKKIALRVRDFKGGQIG